MSLIVIEEKIDKLKEFLQEKSIKNLYIITDNIVNDLYMDYLKENLIGFNYNVFILPSGEENKTMDSVLLIYNDLIQRNIDRDTMILSFGGGVVGDIAGFVAATYKRGLKYIQVPTTLLAQVDSSVGGKVGIDYGGYKNIIGSFYFPEMVWVNTWFLNSLEDREILSGLGEILKYGLIYDYSFFEFIKENLASIFKKNLKVLNSIVERSIAIKDKIVSQDKYDRGLRQKLNFGHTIGHSIEAYYKFDKYNHGEAVILGMIYASYIAKKMDLIDEEYFREVYNLLRKFIEPISFKIEEVGSLIDIMKNDKKNIDNKIRFVLPIGRGKVDLFDDIDEKLIVKSLEYKWI